MDKQSGLLKVGKNIGDSFKKHFSKPRENDKRKQSKTELCDRCEVRSKMYCRECDNFFCKECGDIIHQKGKYRQHTTEEFSDFEESDEGVDHFSDQSPSASQGPADSTGSISAKPPSNSTLNNLAIKLNPSANKKNNNTNNNNQINNNQINNNQNNCNNPSNNNPNHNNDPNNNQNQYSVNNDDQQQHTVNVNHNARLKKPLQKSASFETSNSETSESTQTTNSLLLGMPASTPTSGGSKLSQAFHKKVSGVVGSDQDVVQEDTASSRRSSTDSVRSEPMQGMETGTLRGSTKLATAFKKKTSKVELVPDKVSSPLRRLSEPAEPNLATVKPPPQPEQGTLSGGSKLARAWKKAPESSSDSSIEALNSSAPSASLQRDKRANEPVQKTQLGESTAKATVEKKAILDIDSSSENETDLPETELDMSSEGVSLKEPRVLVGIFPPASFAKPVMKPALKPAALKQGMKPTLKPAMKPTMKPTAGCESEQPSADSKLTKTITIESKPTSKPTTELKPAVLKQGVKPTMKFAKLATGGSDSMAIPKEKEPTPTAESPQGAVPAAQKLDTPQRPRLPTKASSISALKPQLPAKPNFKPAMTKPPETSAQPKTETSTQPKTETSTQPKIETSTQPKTETSTQPKTETSTQPKIETLIQPKTETVRTSGPQEHEATKRRDTQQEGTPRAKVSDHALSEPILSNSGGSKLAKAFKNRSLLPVASGVDSLSQSQGEVPKPTTSKFSPYVSLKDVARIKGDTQIPPSESQSEWVSMKLVAERIAEAHTPDPHSEATTKSAEKFSTSGSSKLGRAFHLRHSTSDLSPFNPPPLQN